VKSTFKLPSSNKTNNKNNHKDALQEKLILLFLQSRYIWPLTLAKRLPKKGTQENFVRARDVPSRPFPPSCPSSMLFWYLNGI